MYGPRTRGGSPVDLEVAMSRSTGRRTVTVNGNPVDFWVASGEVLSRPALIAESDRGGSILEDPASRPSVEEYPEDELVRLYRSRTE